MTTSPAPAAPRTQAQRRASTRRRVLDATLAVLTEQGYAATTTTAIAKRAGVSQGAIFKHFPTKADLLGSAIEDLFPRLTDEYRAAFADLDLGRDPMRAAIRMLWQVFQRPDVQASLELYIAARTDADLAARLGEVERRHRSNVKATASALLPELARIPLFDQTIDLVMDALTGIVLHAVAIPGADDADAEVEVLATLCCGLAGTTN